MAAAAHNSSSSSPFDSTNTDIEWYGPKRLLGTGFGGLDEVTRMLIWEQTGCLAATRRIDGDGPIPKFTLMGPRHKMGHAKQLAKFFIEASQECGRCQHYLPDTPKSENDLSNWIAYTAQHGIDLPMRKRKAVSIDRTESSQPQPMCAPPGLEHMVRK